MHGHFYSFAAYRRLPTSPRRNSLPPSCHQYSGNNQRLFINNPKKFKEFFFACKFALAANHRHPKVFKNFFACNIVLAATYQQPESIQKLFRLQNCLSRKSPISRKYSKTFRPEAAATGSSNQQQQSTAAISSSSQQQQSAAATSSSNQQQQPAAATSSNNQQRQSAFILPAAPTQSTPTSVSYHYGS